MAWGHRGAASGAARGFFVRLSVSDGANATGPKACANSEIPGAAGLPLRWSLSGSALGHAPFTATGSRRVLAEQTQFRPLRFAR